jgi:predicted Fe-S protein YdhL (DUF1289 family)
MARAHEIKSPCTKICQLDYRLGYCIGCYRTRDEIAVWGAADRQERRQILTRARERRRAARGAASIPSRD